MIHLFTGKGKKVFFPKKWANSVTSWLLGVHSPSGTVEIRNTANPTQGGSATFDVNLEKVAQGLRKLLKRDFTSPRQVAEAIASSADGASLVARDGKLLVNENWLANAYSPDLTDYAKKTEANTWTATQNFATGAVTISNGALSATFSIDSSGRIFVNGNGVTLNGRAANMVQLAHAPADTEGTGNTYVATMGWANSVFLRESEVGAEGGAAAYEHAHTTGDITDWAAATADFITAAAVAAFARLNAQQNWTATQTLATGVLRFTKNEFTKTISMEDGTFWINGGVVLNGGAADVVTVNNKPSDSTETGSKVVATVGWANTYLLRKSDTRTTWASGHKLLTTADVCASGDVVPCGSGHAVAPSNHRHSPSTIGLNDAASVTLTSWIFPGSTGINAAVVKTGNANKWMKTDANGNVGTTDEIPIAAPSSANGFPQFTNGNISNWRPANAAGGIALLDNDGKYYIGRIPTGTTGTTVALGNHTHSGYQASSAKLTALEGALDGSGRVPLTMLTGNIGGHSGNCVVTIGSDGTLGHSGNEAFNALVALKEDYTAASNTIPYAKWASGVTRTSVLLGTDANGDFKNLAALPNYPAEDKVLTCKANGTALTWENPPGAPSNPTYYASLLPTMPGTASADSTGWTYDGTLGLKLRMLTRVAWDGSKLYGFYRDMTYSKDGALYSVTGETRYEIDTPTVVSWS